MKKIAIISDVHGNITALKEVLKDIKEKNIQDIICLGDTILKNPHPHECLELVKKHCSVILKGNTDDCVANLTEKKLEHIWTYQQLSPDDIEFLNALPLFYEFYFSGRLIRFLHASPYKLNGIMNIANPSISYQEMFQNTSFLKIEDSNSKPDVVIYGHTHTSALGHYGNKELINVGAVGCPVEILNQDMNDSKNSLTTVANYCIIEGNETDKLDSFSVSFIKVPYDLNKQVELLKQSDMPNKELAIKEVTTGIYEKR